ncbi:hypothetical protein [Stenotrophomonas sp. SORGH_AS_0321]|uniref:hypothetical protein n=1 Tax=Stenotrophomonas sp. SORGH_AS_0321 TaxID=3041787 RepID=UPI00286D1DFC|nr:hypothetical protein [Stenotrophomonas sp. SORGH_AS_0321]
MFGALRTRLQLAPVGLQPLLDPIKSLVAKDRLQLAQPQGQQALRRHAPALVAGGAVQTGQVGAAQGHRVIVGLGSTRVARRAGGEGGEYLGVDPFQLGGRQAGAEPLRGLDGGLVAAATQHQRKVCCGYG